MPLPYHSTSRFLGLCSAIAFSVFSLPLQGEDYVWVLTNPDGSTNWNKSPYFLWTNTDGWRLASDPDGPAPGSAPGASDNITEITGAIGLRITGTNSVNTLTGSAGKTIESGTAGSILKVTTLKYGSSGTFAIRNGTAGDTTLETTAIEVTAGTMTLGQTGVANQTVVASAKSPVLKGLSASTTTVASGATLNINVDPNITPAPDSDGIMQGSGSYSLGLLTVNGTVRLNQAGYNKTAVATVTGITGTGTISGNSLVNNGGTIQGSTTTTLQINTAEDTSYATSALIDTGNRDTLDVVKQGLGTQSLSGANTYSGGTVIEAGTLLADSASGSSTGTGSVVVETDGTLGGTGRIAPDAGENLTVQGTMAPGAEGAVGTLTLALSGASQLILESGAALDFQLGATSDLINFDTVGDWLSGSGNATLNLDLQSGFDYTQTYVIFSNVTTSDFAFADITGFDNAAYSTLLSRSGNDYILSFAPIPEPSAMIYLGLALVGGAGCYLRRRS